MTTWKRPEGCVCVMDTSGVILRYADNCPVHPPTDPVLNQIAAPFM